MPDQVDDADGTDAPPSGRPRGAQPGGNRFAQRNLADRLFPGPSPRMSNQAAERIEGLLNPLDADAVAAWHPRTSRTPTIDGSLRHPQRPPGTPSPVEPIATASPDDIAQLRAALDEQSELLRAILASTVDTQTDARATAQNSRTFAWAGTAIALLTLVATVIALVAAVRAN